MNQLHNGSGLHTPATAAPHIRIQHRRIRADGRAKTAVLSTAIEPGCPAGYGQLILARLAQMRFHQGGNHLGCNTLSRHARKRNNLSQRSRFHPAAPDTRRLPQIARSLSVPRRTRTSHTSGRGISASAIFCMEKFHGVRSYSPGASPGEQRPQGLLRIREIVHLQMQKAGVDGTRVRRGVRSGGVTGT